MECEDDKSMKLCRLCFQSCADNFDVVEEIMRAMFEALLLELDLSLTDQPIICNICVGNLQKLFDFKSLCLQTDNCINSFVSNITDTRLDLMDIYLNKNDVKFADIPACHSICRLCLLLTKDDFCISLTRKSKDIVELLDKYFPELDLYITKDPVMCTACHTALQEYSDFVKNCSYTEETIKRYHETEGTDSKNQVSLKQVLQSMTDVMAKCEKYNEAVGEDGQVGIKAKRESTEFQETNIKHEEVNIKLEPGDCNRYQGINPNLFKYLCELCQYETDHKFRFKEHILIHRNNSEVTTYRCELCTYETKYKRSLDRHMLVHKDDSEAIIFKCDSCPYQTKQKAYLKRHVQRAHQDVSVVTMYKCELCPFTTKFKMRLKKHMVVHRNASKTLTFVCDICGHKLKYRWELIKHAALHKDEDEFQNDLKTPQSVHKDASKVKMLKCNSCNYETKSKWCLRQHEVIHKDASEVTMYKCEVCPHASKRKSDLEVHLRTHKNVANLAMYKCELCKYESKIRSNLTRHMLKHTDASLVTMYKCEVCALETKYRSTWKKHMLSHSV